MSTHNAHAANGGFFGKHRRLVFASALFWVSALWAAQALADGGTKYGGYNNGGGYVGPGPALMTVEQVKGMRDDARVSLQGNIVQSLGGHRYVFRDATGTINVEIGDARWRGQNVGPEDIVEIQGELDKDWSELEIEVKRVIKR